MVFTRNIVLSGNVQQSKARGARFSHCLRSFATLCSAALLAALFTVATSAQVLYGTIDGLVTDPSGAVIPGATITILEVSTNVVHTATAGPSGLYSVTELNPGTYQVRAAAPGFATVQQNGIHLLANSIIRANLLLNIGTANQEVRVTTAPPMLQTEEAVTAYNISTQQVAELPTTSGIGRNVESLYKLVPGSTPPTVSQLSASNPQGAQLFNINGISSEANTTRIDGAVDSYAWMPALVAYLPSTDAIDNVNLVTGSLNAEQGSAGGAAINMTIKTGTNALHGAVWEYNSVAQLNAQSWQNRTGILQKNTYNEFGGSLGGPIMKNKLFFFGDFNRTSLVKGVSGLYSVPTLAMRQGNFLATGVTIYDPATGTATGANKQPFANDAILPGRFAPAAVTLLANLPLPNTGSASSPINNYNTVKTTHFFRTSTDLKISYVPTQATTFFARYSASPTANQDPQVFGINPGGPSIDGGSVGSGSSLIQNVGLGATHVFTSHFVVDGNMGYARMGLQLNAPDLTLGNYGENQLGIPGTNDASNPGDTTYGGIPAMVFTSLTNLGNDTTSDPYHFYDSQLTGNLNGTYTHGSHSVRFGGEYIHFILNHQQSGTGSNSTPRGNFTFTGGVTTPTGGTATAQSSFADFLLGQAYTYYKGVQFVHLATLRESQYGFFAQDTWQASKNLTLNYGVRYEYYPLPVADRFGYLRYDPSVLTSVTDNLGTHNVGTVLVGGQGSTPKYSNTNNGHGNIVPRFGVSYRVNDKTVIRAGFGMAVDPATFYLLLTAYPNDIAVQVNGANSAVAATSINPGLVTNAPQVGIPVFAQPNIASGAIPLPASVGTYYTPQTFRRGYVYSDNLSIQRELPYNFTTTIAYVNTEAVRQVTTINTNASYPGGGTAGYLLDTTYGANVNNSTQSAEVPFRGSNYNGLQTQLSRQSDHHGSTGIVYTYSKTMDSSDNGQFAGSGTGGSGLIFMYPTYWNRDYAVAGIDRKHNFQWWTVVPFPFGHDQPFLTHGVAGYILGDWQLSTVLSRVSGTPFTVLGSSTLLNAPGNTQVADVVPGVSSVLNSKVNGARQYLNYAAYCDVASKQSRTDCPVVTVPRFGSSSRDGVRGPGIFDLDVSLKRSFPIRERFKLVLAAEAFDVTNTPQFANPTASINTVTLTGGAIGLNGFGTITTSNVNRSMRLSGRLTF